MKIVRRDEWGALPQARLTRVEWPAKPPVVVHHTVSAATPTLTPRQEAAIMRGFDVQHYFKNQWAGGIGYSYVIFPSGRVYEGRGINTQGAHSPGANHLPGVALVGDFRTEQPTANAMRALSVLGGILTASEYRGHRDFYATACPGDALYRLLPTLVPGILIDPEPAPLPHNDTLRLYITPAGSERKEFKGWDACKGPLRWIAKTPLQPDTVAAIAWNHATWHGPRDVSNVALHLVRKYLTGGRA